MAAQEIKVNINGDTSGLDNALSKGQANLARFAKVGAVAIAAAGAALVGLTKTSLANIDTLTKQARSLGLTTAAFQEMTLVAGEAGIESGKLSSMLGLMQRNIVELSNGTKLQTEAFGKLGLSIADLQGLSPDEQFAKIAASLDAVKDPAEKTALAMEVFGRSGKDAINMLSDYSAKAAEAARFQKEFGIAVSQFDAETIEAANDAFGRIAMALSGLGNIMAANVAPAIVALSNGFLDLVGTGSKFRDAIGFIGDNLDVLGALIVGLAATTIPAMVVSLTSIATAFMAGATATGILSAALVVLKGAFMLLGGPIGIAAGLIGAAAAYFLIFRDNAGEAETASYDAAAGTSALNGALDVFYQTAAPSAGKAAIALANDNRKLAESAYEAAKGELAKQKAMLLSSSAAYEANLTDVEGAAMLGYAMDKRVLAHRSSLEKLAAAENALEQARRDNRSAASAITGAEYGAVTLPGAPPVVTTTTPGVAGGAGIASDMAARLEALQEGFATEAEVVAEWYAQGQETLIAAEDAKLLTHEEYIAAKLALDEQYHSKVAAMNDAASQHEIDMKRKTVDAVIGLVSTMGSRSEKLAKVAVALNAAKAIAETIQNTAAASVRALVELGPIAGPPAAARIKMYGAAQVGIIGANAALSMGSRGGGGGGGSAGAGSSAATAAPAQQQATTFAFTLQNDPMGFGESFARQLIDQLNSTQRNGGQIRGVLA
jgi:hypothetical protein